jgi:hypothetical protein
MPAVLGDGSAQVNTGPGRMRLPSVPADEPWDCSAAAVIAPYLPGVLRRVPHLLDRFGAVRLSGGEIGIDGTRSVAWSNVVEVRTRPMLDVAATAAGDNLNAWAARLIPPVPVLARVARGGVAAVADRAAAAILAVFLAALGDRPDLAGVTQVPVEVVHRARLRRPRTMSAGLVSSAILCLPQVAASVLATAHGHGVPIVGLPPSGSVTNARELAGVLRERHRAALRRGAAE